MLEIWDCKSPPAAGCAALVHCTGGAGGGKGAPEEERGTPGAGVGIGAADIAPG